MLINSKLLAFNVFLPLSVKRDRYEGSAQQVMDRELSPESMLAMSLSPYELYTTFYNDLFVLKMTAMFNGQLAQIDFSENDELSLRCCSPELSLCFSEVSVELGMLLRKYGVWQVNSIWCGAEPFIHVSCMAVPLSH